MAVALAIIARKRQACVLNRVRCFCQLVFLADRADCEDISEDGLTEYNA